MATLVLWDITGFQAMEFLLEWCPCLHSINVMYHVKHDYCIGMLFVMVDHLVCLHFFPSLV